MSDQPAQYTVSTRTRFGGRELGGDTQPIHDPFVHSGVEVTLGRRDAIAQLLRPRKIYVDVHVDGTRAALRHVMQPIDLTPNEDRPNEIPSAYSQQFGATHEDTLQELARTNRRILAELSSIREGLSARAIGRALGKAVNHAAGARRSPRQ